MSFAIITAASSEGGTIAAIVSVGRHNGKERRALDMR
jgi:hypothetical protein